MLLAESPRHLVLTHNKVFAMLTELAARYGLVVIGEHPMNQVEFFIGGKPRPREITRSHDGRIGSKTIAVVLFLIV